MTKRMYLISGLIISFLVCGISSYVFADSNYGLDDTAKEAGLMGAGSNLPTVLGTVIGAGLSMISVVFFVLIVYGGIMYMTARGDSSRTEKGVSTIIAATVGIVIVMGAYALTNFVFNIGGFGGPQTPPPPPPNPGKCVVSTAYCAQSQGDVTSGEVCAEVSLDFCQNNGNNQCIPKLLNTPCSNLSLEDCAAFESPDQSSEDLCVWAVN